MNKAKFKRGDMFYHPEQKLFIIIEDKAYYPNTNKNGDSGWLYDLKCFQSQGDEPKPFKRYYENKMINTLEPIKKTNAVKVLYGSNDK